MHDAREPDRLLTIASAIADGTRVEWPELADETPDDEKAVVDALKALDGIVHTHRRLQDEALRRRPERWAHFTLLDTISSGDGWTLHRARDGAAGRDVTLVVVGPLDGDAETVDRILRDARRRAEVHHPHLAAIFGADYADDRVGVWSEWLTGRTAHEEIEAAGALPWREAVNAVAGLANAVARLHQARLVHGAVSPSMVLRTNDGRWVLRAWLPNDGQRFVDDTASLGALLLVLAGIERSAGTQRRWLARQRHLERIAARAASTDSRHGFGGIEAFEAALAEVGSTSAFGIEWVVGFGISALVVAVVLWLAT